MGDPSPKILLNSKDKGCRVFQGGNVGHLHSLLSIESSSQVYRTSYFSKNTYPTLDYKDQSVMKLQIFLLCHALVVTHSAI